MKIAFVGLGNMGGGMAANLAKHGHNVSTFDLSAEALSRSQESGCTPCSTVAQAVTNADAVVTMLPNGAIVRDVYTNEVFHNAPVGALLLDCSTIDVSTARDVANLAQAVGYEMVDAPVSGGIAAAAGGVLTFMVGGSVEAFERAHHILDAMGKTVIQAGASGAGQAAKLCNNMLLAIHMIGTCEAFAMAQKLGLDPQVFYDISSVSSGQNWSMTSYCPVAGVGPNSPADVGFVGGFATQLMLKDLTLALAAADDVGVSPEMGRRAFELYTTFAQSGNTEQDFSAIIETL